MPSTLCERIAAPLLDLHRKTTPVLAVVLLGAVAASSVAYGVLIGNHHIAWGGALVTVVAWYGFLLSGCERLLTAKDQRIMALEQQLALDLSPTLLFAYPTVRNLAEQLDKLLDHALAEAEQVTS